MFWILCVLGHLACSVVAYFMIRSTWRMDNLRWTVGRRRLAIIVVTAIGPVAVLAICPMLLANLLDDDTPANW